MTIDQQRLLTLHARHVVECSQWLFRGGLLRCESGRHVVTINAQEVADLVDAGLLEPVGAAGLRLTDQGRKVVH
jgi:hypothetical protein